MLYMENFIHVTLSYFIFSDNPEHKLWENKVFRQTPLPLPLPPKTMLEKLTKPIFNIVLGGGGSRMEVF